MRTHDATMVMSGGSRGIGLAIALAAARHGANIVRLAKTDQPDPRLPGTIHTAAEAITAAGGQALPVVGDARREEDVARAAAAAVERFGGVDIVITNASAIDLRGTAELTTKRFDLMQQVNVRGTHLLTKACLPALRGSADARVITLSPPLNPADTFEAEVSAVMASLIAGPVAAFANTKEAINAATLAELDDALEREHQGQSRLLTSRDFREGVQAFQERRPPRFNP